MEEEEGEREVRRDLAVRRYGEKETNQFRRIGWIRSWVRRI